METNTANAIATQSAKVVLNILPWGMLTAVAAFLCSMTIQRIIGNLSLRPLRQWVPGHWTEKARLAYPGWLTLVMGQIIQPFLWFIVTIDLPTKPSLAVGAMVAFAAFLGAGVASIRLESRVRERTISLYDWTQSWTVQVLIFMPTIIVFLVMARWLPAQFNWTAVWIILTTAGMVVALSLGGGTLAVARWIGLLRPPTQRLQTIVNLAVQRMGVKLPVVYVLRWKAANALAFPFSEAVAVTDTALNSLSDEQLAAICHHELAHLNEPRHIHFARLAGQFVWLPLFLLGPLHETLGFQNGFLVAMGTFLIGYVLVRRMVLAMEKRADSAGKAHEGETGTYARALEKLYEINLMPAVLRSRIPTHPHLYDRLLAAGIQPDYPRPQPPSRWRTKVAIVLLILGTLFCMFMWLGIIQAVQSSGHPAPHALPISER